MWMEAIHKSESEKKNAPLVEVKFVGGYTVRCTAEHLFLTCQRMEVAEFLTPHLEIQSSLMNLHNISMEDYIESGQTKPIYPEEEKAS